LLGSDGPGLQRSGHGDRDVRRKTYLRLDAQLPRGSSVRGREHRPFCRRTTAALDHSVSGHRAGRTLASRLRTGPV